MLSLITSNLVPVLVGVGALLASILGVYFKGKAVGADKAKREVEKQEKAARDTAAKVEQKVAAQDPAKNRDELSKWSKGK